MLLSIKIHNATMVVSSYQQRMLSKSLSECLKPWIVPNPYIMLFFFVSIHTSDTIYKIYKFIK